MRKIYLFIVILVFIVSPISYANQNIIHNSRTNAITPHKELTDMPNVIMLVGDGMGPEQVRLASLVEYGVEYGSIMDTDFLKQQQYTTNTINDAVTDSGAGGTALATGQLTRDARISIDPNSQFYYKTILEYLISDFGYSAGIVTTMESTHATAAVFAAHTSSRDNKEDIRTQMQPKTIDVILGGGGKTPHLGPNEATAIQKGQAYGYEVVVNRDQLIEKSQTADKLLGVFTGGSRMEYEIDRDLSQDPSLLEMVSVAFDILQRKNKPDFLMVESGNIDTAGHKDENDPNKSYYNAMETIMFEKTIRLAFDIAKSNGNTIVIVAADHETGGLTIHDFNNLDSTLPSLNNTREENLIIRSIRAKQINTTWQWNAHTSRPVKFYGYGSDFGNHNISINTDVFWALNKALGSFPTVLRQRYDVNGTNLVVTATIKDQDMSAEKFSIFVKYANGTQKEFQFNLDIVEEKVYQVSVPIDTSLRYKSFIKVHDGVINDIMSFDSNNNLVIQIVEYIEPVTSSSSEITTSSTITSTTTPTFSETSSSETSDDNDASIIFLLTPISIAIMTYKHRKRPDPSRLNFDYQ